MSRTSKSQTRARAIAEIEKIKKAKEDKLAREVEAREKIRIKDGNRKKRLKEQIEKKIADRGPEHRALAILYKDKPAEEESKSLRPAKS